MESEWTKSTKHSLWKLVKQSWKEFVEEQWICVMVPGYLSQLLVPTPGLRSKSNKLEAFTGY